MNAVFAILAPLRFLRGSILDPFGHTAERRAERALVREYEQIVDALCAGLRPERQELALQLASWPDEIRGFGHVKLRNLAQLQPRLARWRAQWAA